MKKEKIMGKDAFESYYSMLFGERWPCLEKSLLDDTMQSSICHDGLKPYYLDGASILVALCLPVRNAGSVLDMCAAPGGKTLVLSGNLSENAVMFSNEKSAARKSRLSNVVSECIPESMQKRIKVSCSDAATWCRRESERYDSILLDAPCSSERHVLKDIKYLSEWTPSRIKTICMEQWALLSCAFRLLSRGGYLLYATCALAEKENDGNMKRFLDKFPECEKVSLCDVRSIFEKNLSTLELSMSLSENIPSLGKLFDTVECTEHGFRIMPDRSLNAGPLYFSLVRKT